MVDGIFEWDSDKDTANQTKHNVSFAEAATAFADPNAYLADDGTGTERLVLVGFSAFARLLTVVHVERTDMLRVISAWRATAEEQRRYTKG